MDYKSAGVDVAAGRAFVERIRGSGSTADRSRWRTAASGVMLPACDNRFYRRYRRSGYQAEPLDHWEHHQGSTW